MSARCLALQDLLAEAGPTALQADVEAQRHLERCEACFAFLESLAEVDGALRALPLPDAPDALVERLLARVRATDAAAGAIADEPSAPPRGVGVRLAHPAAAARSLAVAAPGRLRAALRRHPARFGVLATACLTLAITWSLLPLYLASPDIPAADLDDAWHAAAETEPPASFRGGAPLAQRPRSDAPATPAEGLAAAKRAQGGRQHRPSAEEAPREDARLEAARPSASLDELQYRLSQSLSQRANEAFAYLGETAPSGVGGRLGTVTGGRRAEGARLRALADRPSFELGDRLSAIERDEAAGKAQRTRPAGPALGLDAERRTSFALGESPAARFQRERLEVGDLPFVPASGYWANTYVPGDPVMRWLESRLHWRARPALAASGSGSLLLEAAARQPAQPFDPPAQSALAVYLHADRSGIEGESRLLVQVGLQGTHRHSGLRPPLQVAVVLDARGAVSPEVAASMRAVLDAFLAARDVGDRFALFAAGKRVEPLDADAFRHGPLAVTLSRIVEGGVAGGLDLPEALERAVRSLERGDDASAPLGSSMVVLLTAQPLGPLTERLAAIAHASAVAGIPTSVIGLGERLELEELERVTLAGQGNRRLVATPADAERSVDRELSALSRAVARAVRLRIRLAPGVRLVDVIGSSRLDAAGATRARQAERAIDRRMASSLGIEADRGEDEEGIQVVIPTYYAGDAHAVLLDVVAPGPGPIADVTARYKDLVHLRNGVARANLTLGHRATAEGPLEWNVTRNLLAIRLSDVLKRAGRALLAGQDAHALALVRDHHALLQSLRREAAPFRNDPEVARDLAMLGEYVAVIESGLAPDGSRDYVADSLQLAGYRKTLPRSPEEWEPTRRGP